MIQLLIMADDLTGALDTGVQFSKAGCAVKVVTDTGFPFDKERTADVLVLDTETRHIESQAACDIIYRIACRAVECGIPHIFKKTDSALRGNVGSELAALLDASKEAILPFVPAFPRMNRTTKDGIQFIDHIPVADSVFGKDPYEPLAHSSIPDILHETCQVPAVCIQTGGQVPPDCRGIAVFDVETEQELRECGEYLKKGKMLRILAGCAGLAEILPDLLDWQKQPPEIRLKKTDRLLIACGSVNPISSQQLDHAEERGAVRIHLTPGQKIERGYWDTEAGKQEVENISARILDCSVSIIDCNDIDGNISTETYVRQHGFTADEVRINITASIGILVKKLMEGTAVGCIMVIGGDTLLGFLEQIEVSEMRPVCELLPGTVLSEFSYEGSHYSILSKSGGFGSETLLTELAAMLVEDASCEGTTS